MANESTALTRAKQLEQAKGEIYKVLNNGKTLAAFKAAWPDGTISPQTIATQVFSVVARRPEILECEPRSVVATCVEGSLLGLSFLPHLKQAAIVAFKETQPDGTKVKKAQLIVEYMGLVKLATNSGVLSYVDAHIVHENDVFEYQLGIEPDLKHIPARSDRGAKIGVYATGKLQSGDIVFRFLSADEVMSYRNRSKAADSGPWVSDEDAMWRKTAIRRLVGYLPMDEKTARAVMNDEMAETEQGQTLAPEIFADDYIDVTPTEEKKSKTEEAKARLKKEKPAPAPPPAEEPTKVAAHAEEAPALEIREAEPEGDPLRDRMYESVSKKVRDLFPSRMRADVAVSEATSGKLQSYASLAGADMATLQMVDDYVRRQADEALGG